MWCVLCIHTFSMALSVTRCSCLTKNGFSRPTTAGWCACTHIHINNPSTVEGLEAKRKMLCLALILNNKDHGRKGNAASMCVCERATERERE